MAKKTNDANNNKAANPAKKPVAKSADGARGTKRNVKKPQPASSAKAKQTAFERQRLTEKQNRREFLGVIFFVLAFVFFLCWFNTNTVLLRPLTQIVSGLFGQIGRYLLPFLCVYIGIILFTNYGYPVRMRTWCSFFTFVFLCAVIHSISDFFGSLGNRLSIVQLWKNGLIWKSGGVIPGIIAEVLTVCITRFGAIVLMTIFFLLCLFATQSITIPGIIAAMNKREPRVIQERKEDPSERFVNRMAQVHQSMGTRSKYPQNFDIPVDDPPLVERDRKKKQWHETISPSEYMEHEEEKKRVDIEKQQLTIDEIELHDPVEPRSRSRTGVSDPFSVQVQPPVVAQEIVVEHTVTSTVMAPSIQTEREKAPESTKVTKADAVASAAVISQEIAEQHDTEVAYVFPSIDLLNQVSGSTQDATAEMRGNSKRLADALQSFGINPHIVDVIRGPSVTRYELELDSGVKLSKITNLSEDIALALGAQGVRISAVPDKISVVGIEVPNKIVNTVYAREVIGSNLFTEKKSKVSFAVGKDISGSCIIGDIGKMPHMLIAGTTGSGKSVCMNTLIVSLLYKAKPEEVKLIMVDPKMVELGIYNGIPHLLIPVVTDPKKAAGALQWTVTEMLRRYRLMSDEGVRDLESYNKAVANDPDQEKLAQIVVVIDELADLMLVAAKEVEESICRIAQMGRASGIHLVIATQRPSADVITGTMKANIPSRIAFSVSSAMESRIILDMQGAEKLVGKGDMLFAPHGQGKPQRVQGCFITDDEVSRVVAAIKANSGSNYSDEVMEQIDKRVEQGNKNSSSEPAHSSEDGSDEMLPAAVEVILETGQASVSMLQRRLKLGYARAARIVDEMEEKGIVGPFEGAKPRQLLITRDQWEQMKSGTGVTEPVPDELP